MTEVKDYWNVKNKLKDNFYYTIKIPISKNNVDMINHLEGYLMSKGITFDTGYDMKTNERHWELDWFLKGANPKKVIQVLDSHNIPYKIYITKKDENE